MVAAQRHQARQGDLGGVAAPAEHGFAEHHGADVDHVQAANQFAVDPRFHRMGHAGAVQAHIGLHHGGQDPGAALAVARRLRASLDHPLEVVVDAHVETLLGLQLLNRLAQRAVQAELAREQHHARIGAPPKNGLARAVPGKDAARVRGHQRGHVQHAAGGQQARRGIVRAPGLLDRRERLPRLQPGQRSGGGRLGHGAGGVGAVVFPLLCAAPPWHQVRADNTRPLRRSGSRRQASHTVSTPMVSASQSIHSP